MEKVLFLVNHDVVIYNFRRELVERLIHDGYEVVISSPYGERIELLKQMGCRYVEVNMDRHGKNPFDELRLRSYYRDLISRERPKIIFSFTIKPNLYGAMAAASYKVPIVVNITGLGTAVENKGFMGRFIVAWYKTAFRKVQTVFVQNVENKQYFIDHHIAENKLKLLPGSGVNLEDHNFEPYPKTEPYTDRFLFIGRVMKDKGIDELLEVAERIKREFSEVSFDILGDYEEDYAITIHMLEQHNIVKYWGMRLDVHPFIKNCNAVILPSYHEGMANVLLEAAATGRPVLASKIPGCIETFEEGVSGLGFNPRDAEDLYQTIKKFLQLSWKEKAAMGLAAREKMEREFDRNIVIDAYLEELKALED